MENDNKIFTGFFLGLIVSAAVVYLVCQKKQLKEMNRKELQDLLDLYVSQEKYEQAAKIRDILGGAIS